MSTAHHARRTRMPAPIEDYVAGSAAETAARDADATEAEIDRLIAWNRQIHDADCVNLNPATNAMNPRAEAALASGLGARPSLGYPGDKYEMGLEAIERIEVICAELACEIFGAKYAEIRVASGALGNLYAFMATAKPGDAIIVPPPAILSYGFIYSAMKRRPPTGYLNTSVRFEYLAPLRAGAELTLNLSVEDKFIKRERKYIVLKAVVEDVRGGVVACAHVDCIFPA